MGGPNLTMFVEYPDLQKMLVLSGNREFRGSKTSAKPLFVAQKLFCFTEKVISVETDMYIIAEIFTSYNQLFSFSAYYRSYSHLQLSGLMGPRVDAVSCSTTPPRLTQEELCSFLKAGFGIKTSLP